MTSAEREVIRQRLGECWYTDPDDAAHDLEALLAEVARLQGLLDRKLSEIDRIADEMQSTGSRYKSHDLGYVDSVDANRVDEWADELKALRWAIPSSPQEPDK